MKIEKSVFVSFILLVIIASLYRVIPGRPWGFTPQIAMALFSGSIVKDKRFSFLLPLFSMFVSDFLYEILYRYQITPIQGFYNGQVLNYIFFCGLTVVGFAINKKNWLSILGGSVAGVLIYFILSNGAVWLGGGLDINNQPYPKTLNGLMTSLAAGLPFLKGSLYGTLFFSGILFGGHYLLWGTERKTMQPARANK